MLPSRNERAALAVLAVALPLLTSCTIRESDPAALDVSPRSREEASLNRDLTFRLVPVGEEPPSDGPTAEAIGRELLRGIADDPATPEVLVRLYGGWPGRFEPLAADASDAALQAAPVGDAVFMLRAAELGIEPGDQGSVIARVALGRVARVRASTRAAMAFVPEAGTEAAQASTPQGPPQPEEAFLLLVEDQILRHHPQWIVSRKEQIKEDSDAVTPEQRRAVIDRRIAEHASRIRASYGLAIEADTPK